MVTITVNCPIPECTYSTGDVPEAIAVALLNTHALLHTPSAAASRPAGPKLDRPSVSMGITLEEWNIFHRRWNVFQSGSRIADAAAAPHIFQCADGVLGDALLKVDSDITTRPPAELLEMMKTLAVIPVATGVLRAELLNMKQKRDEPYRSFSSRVRGKAETCAFLTTSLCSCGVSTPVDYTDQIIRDVLIAGVYDADIRRDVLGIDGITDRAVNEVISLVEKREMARDANSVGANMSSFSSYKKEARDYPGRQRPHPPPGLSDTPSSSRMNERIPCPLCGNQFAPFKEGRAKPHEMCIDCFRLRRGRRNRKGQNGTTKSSVSGIGYEDQDDLDVISQVSVISRGAQKADVYNSPGSFSNTRQSPAIKLNHHIFSSGEWRRARLLEHPTLDMSLSINKRDYKSFSRKSPVFKGPVGVQVKLDTCAQSCLWSLGDCLASGFKKEDLIPVSLSLSAANKSSIDIVGALFVRLSGVTPDNIERSCVTMVYVSPCAEGFFLSLEAMLDLGLLRPDSPFCPAALRESHAIDHLQSARSEGNLQEVSCHMATSSKECSCPERGDVPIRPSSLPFPPVPEKNSKMKAWLLEQFGSSTFNVCPHQNLPSMTGPVIKIHVAEDATPKAFHTPAHIPLHWKDQVHADLLRDEALGVIERVPYGEPVNWCHRMVITRKHDGSPRRTVDLSPLNRYCKRETFPSESPFCVARRIPKGAWKTVTDAWNGFHGMLLDEESRPLTTFITPFGRFRYIRAPQGYLSSGDGYNRRLNEVLTDFLRKERCVDDTCHHDEDLEEHWWRTIDLLILLGKSGVVLNPQKFQFAQTEVQFAGFHISMNDIKPLPKYLNSIQNFPTPSSVTDIRSWFGLVNQVANYAQLRDLMAPFKPFLSPRVKFYWTPELEKIFCESKYAIVEAIKNGVEIFDPTKRTCLRPDWSKSGIGYYLSQKHCSCLSPYPDCCEDGWRVTLVGSRFLHGAEQRYAPIEGEALAVVWGLEQTRYFTQGCNDLLVVTDHKPLVKILGDRTLDEITNTRLFRLKQRTLPWQFDIVHMPGLSNCVADATSRHPCDSSVLHHTDLESLLTEGDHIEYAFNAAIVRETSDLISLSWEEIAEKTIADPVLCLLGNTLQDGFPLTIRTLDSRLAPFWNVRNSLYVGDMGVILYGDRVLIPSSLRHHVIQILHSAHQGISGMEARARSLIYWPGISSDIKTARESCALCCKNAPSQPSLPTVAPDIPSTPFESIFADFCYVADHQFLIAGDRLSGWVEVFSSKSGGPNAGAGGLIAHLRSLFAIFGVPIILSSDGGPEFTASATSDFLRRWGVHHRKSSAYFPQSNGRAELAVKKVKRFLPSCIGRTGTLNTDKFLQGMLQIRNTPDSDCKLSPAQIVFGRPLRDAFSFVNRQNKFENASIHPIWRDAWKCKESAMRVRFTKTVEDSNKHSHQLPKLSVGDAVFVQNQTGSHPLKWDRSGTVVECRAYDQYLIKIHGTGRITPRNRKFLRKYTLPDSPPTGSGLQFRDMEDRELSTKDYVGENPALPLPSQETRSGGLSNHAGASVDLGISPSPDNMVESESMGTLIDDIQLSPNAQPSQSSCDTPEVMPSNSDTSADASSSPMYRPKRSAAPPKRYIPETGKWL